MLIPSWYVLPCVLAALVSLVAGVVVIVRERFSTTGWLHFVLAGSVFVWQCCLAATLAAPSAEVAHLWSVATTAVVILVPAMQIRFTHWITHGRSAKFNAVVVGWIGAAVLEALLLTSDGFALPAVRHEWGWFVRYGPVGFGFLAYAALAIGTCHWLYLNVLRSNPRGSAAWSRARMLIVALMVGSVGAVDFATAFGADLFPFGGVFTALGLIINIVTTLRYRLIEITPALAAQELMDTMSDGVIVLDHEGVVRLVNPTACEILGYRAEQLAHALPPKPVATVLFGPDTTARFPETAFRHAERRYELPSIGQRTLSVSISIVSDRANRAMAAVATLQDVTATRAAQEQIHRLAYFDPLTGLPNRLLLKERFHQVLSWADRTESHAAVLFLDLDRFKQVNDRLGHDAGDLLLKTVAERVSACIRDSDIVARHRDRLERSTLARLGGDEFVLLLTPIDRGEDAAKVAQRILQVVSAPVKLKGGEEVSTGVSIGIALYPGDGEDADTLMKKADIAMYHAKEAGRQAARFFDERLNDATSSRFSLETGIRKAIVGQEFLLRYQPVLAVRNGAITAVDVQLFWNHPQRGMLDEREFSDVASDMGVAPTLGAWVIRTACVQIAAWSSGGSPPLSALVRVSPPLLERGSVVDAVRDALEQVQVDPQRLWLCLPPVRPRAMQAELAEVIHALADLGVKVVFDDFGTGRLSVEDLVGQQVQMARLNGNFITDVARERNAPAAARALLGLVHGLGMQALGSGIDSREALDMLRAFGYDYLSGDAIAASVSAEEIPDLLESFERIALV